MINTQAIYYYQNNPYVIVDEGKFKLIDLLERIGVNRNIIAGIVLENAGKWIDVVIYKPLYNCDFKICVREKSEFFELFKTKEDDTSRSNM